MKYIVDEEEWFPLKRGFRWACCDCSLVHDVEAIGRWGSTEIRILRNDRATAAMRRKHRRKVIIIENA